VAGSLDVTNEAGIDRIRQKSLRMTGYLMYLADTLLSEPPYGFRVLTPRDESRRGGHVALVRDDHSLQIKEALGPRGVVADFRPPDVIRIAPSPLYSTYHEIWTVVSHVREIIDRGEHERLSGDRREIS
jgi:kynureninase